MSTLSDLSRRTAIVVGASRGLGRGIATALAEAGAPVVAVARTARARVAEPAGGTHGIRSVVADAARCRRWRAACSTATTRRSWSWWPARPRSCARCSTRPGRRSRSTGTRTSGSRSTGCARHCSRRCQPGSRVIVISSGAALHGSPLSGGYAGAKATQRFITGYAQDEARRAGLDITFTAVLPRLTPLTDLGRPGGRGVRGSQRPVRGGVSPSGSASRSRRRSRAPPWSSSCGRTRDDGRPRLPADRRRITGAALTGGSGRCRGPPAASDFATPGSGRVASSERRRQRPPRSQRFGR